MWLALFRPDCGNSVPKSKVEKCNENLDNIMDIDQNDLYFAQNRGSGSPTRIGGQPRQTPF